MPSKAYSLAFLCIFLSTTVNLSHGSSAETALFKEIKENSEKGNSKETHKLGESFIAKYPHSPLLPDVYWYLGKIEPDPKKAVSMFAKIVLQNPGHAKGDLAQFTICSIEYLSARYDSVARESDRGIKLFPKGPHIDRYRLFLAKSYYHTGKYSKAKDAFISLTDSSHNSELLPEALMTLALVEKKISGHSRPYITCLRDLLLGFPDSPEVPSALIMVGEYYESRKMINHAYSSYTSLVNKYPKSPEAGIAAGRLSEIIKYKPQTVDFIPGNDILEKAESLDISPDYEPESKNDRAFFAVSIGPLDTKKRLGEMKKLLNEFTVVSAFVKDGYMVYVGKCSTTDGALNLKIRLAEEFGINGTIVKFNAGKNHKFIFGE